MKRTRRNQPEAAMQRAVFAHIRARGVPGLLAWHTPNGGARSKIEAAIFKGLGVLPGVCDIIAIHEGRMYAIELKSEDGRLTPAQADFLTMIEAAGAYTAVCKSIDRAIACLETWGLLRGEVQ